MRPPFQASSTPIASAMERVLLVALGEHLNHPRIAQPSLSLSSLDARTLHLQTNSIEISTIKAYTTGAKDC